MEGLDAEKFWMGFSIRIAVGVCLGMIWAWLLRGFVRILADGLHRLRQEVADLLKHR